MSNSKNRQFNKYALFVEHPRYGRGPHITGLDPSPLDSGISLHWNTTDFDEIVARFESITGTRWPYGHPGQYSKPGRRIANTAILADLNRQTPATVAVTHYFDLQRECRDCGRPFIFFAREQKHWYEQLGFGLDSDCVRCVDCRKRQQGIAFQRELYETLFHIPDKTLEQCLQMAELCVSLIESGVFSTKQTQRVRMLLNKVPDDHDVRKRSRFGDLVKRVLVAENNTKGSPLNRPLTSTASTIARCRPAGGSATDGHRRRPG